MAGAFVAGAIVSSLILDTKKWSSSVSKVNSDQAKMAGMSEKTAAKFRKVGAGMTIVGGAILAGMGKAVSAFGDFDQAMTESTSIMGEMSSEMREQMEQTALEMSENSVFAAKDLGEAYFFLASAGLDAEASIGALPLVTAFATAGAFDLSTATDLLTDAQSALGLTVDDTAQSEENMVRVSDVLVKANTLANASVMQFSEALTNKAGAAMRAYGIDVESGVAVLAAFADQGTKGRDAGTQFSIVLRELQKAALQNKEAFKAAGVAVYDANGNFNNMGDIVAQLEDRLDPMSAEMKKAEMSTLGFSEKSQMALLTLMGTSDKIKEYEKNLRSAGGITDEVAQKQLLGFNNQMTMAKNKIMAAAISIGEQLAPTVVSLATTVSNVVSKIRDFSEANPVLFGTITKLVAGLGAMLVILGPMVMMLPRLVSGMKLAGLAATKLGVKMNVALGPIGLVTLALLAASAALSTWINHQIKAHDADMDAMVADKSLSKMLKARKVLIEGNIVTQEEWTEIFNKHGRDHKRVMLAIDKNPAYANLKKKLDDVKEAQEEAGEATDDHSDAAGGLNANLGIMKTKIGDLESPFDNYILQQFQLAHAYSDGEIGMGQYVKRMADLKEQREKNLALFDEEEFAMEEQIEGIEGVVEGWESLPPATQSVLAQVGIYFEDSTTEIEKHARTLTTEKLPTLWDAYLEYFNRFTQQLAYGFSGIFVDMLGIAESMTYQMQEFDNSYYQNSIDQATRAFEEKEALMQSELDALLEKANAALKAENQTYRDRKKWIRENVKDEAKRAAMLAQLEAEHEKKRNDIIAERKKKAKELRDALLALEQDHQTDVDGLRADEDTARQQHADDELARQNSLWNQVKGVFGGAIESMLGAWSQDFIGGLISDITNKLIPAILGIGDAGEKAAEKAAGALADALDSGAGDVAGGFESVSSALSSAMPAINMISGAVTAIASVAALFKKAGPSSTDSWHFEQTWIASKQLTDYTMAEIGSSSGWFSRLHTVTMDVHVDLQNIRKMLRERVWGELKKIHDETIKIAANTDPVPGLLKDINRSIKGLKKAQHGYSATQPELVMLHGTPAKPEHAIPDDRLRSLLAMAEGRGGGGGGDVSLEQNVNFNGLMISDRDYMRTRGIPELLEALKANVGLADLKEIIGVT